MGDPLSATAFVLSLPGIFMSCVQCFELIQTGRNLEQDLLIRTTKFSNQQLRFTKWGVACGFGTPDGYNRGLDDPTIQPHIARTLQSVQQVLNSGVTLIRRYEEKSAVTGVVASTKSRTVLFSWTALKERMSGTGKGSAFKDAARWAIEDKKKLDEIIKDVFDLIGDLEYFTKDLGIAARQRVFVQYEIESISDMATLETIEASRVGELDIVSDSASVRLQSLRGSSTRRQGSDLNVATSIASGTYVTAPETSESRHLLPTMPEDEEPWNPAALVVPQNRRIMERLLAEAFPTHATPSRHIDASLVGKSLQSLCLKDVAETIEKELHVTGGLPTKAHRWIVKQLNNMYKETERELPYFALYPITSNLRFFIASIEGPPGTPYEGGVFHLVLRIRDGYPFQSPRCQFATKIYHPNIDASGKICLDLLDDNWSPAIMLVKILVSIVSLLDDPGLDDPLVPEIAELYIRNQQLYEENARLYTAKYAKEVNPSQEVIDKCIGICMGEERLR
jgi:ubiquitin-protein ligase